MLVGPAMSAVLTNEVTQGTEVNVSEFFFPKGLLGFENVKKYSLTSKENETPFSRLRMEEGQGYTLMVMPVMGLFPDYDPSFCKEDLAELEIEDPQIYGFCTWSIYVRTNVLL